VSGELAELAAKAIAAINSQDPRLIAVTFDPRAEIRTSRNVHTGIEAAIRWAEKSYDHLDRRYTINATHARGDAVLVLGSVDYVWREEGEVGDSSPIALRLEFRDGLVTVLTVAEDAARALDEFEASGS
jgi:hypothetical protein